MTPHSEAELAEAIRSTDRPLSIIGGGTRSFAHATSGQTLSLSKLSGIELYEPGALTLVAKAGTPLDEIENTLAENGQQLAFEPMDHRALLGTTGTPTIGGVVAANISGPRRVQVGACRDYLLGVRFVDGNGTILKNGGRVMKNVTGYDLVKLMAGSFGTIGVLSEVSFKVLPVSEQSAMLTLPDLTHVDAQRAMSLALSSPFEVTGAAHLPQSGETVLRLEGFKHSVNYRAEKLSGALGGFGEVHIEKDHQTVSNFWKQIRDVLPFQDKKGDVWRLSVTPSQASKIIEEISPLDVIYDWGGGLLWVLTQEGSDLRIKFGGKFGHATLIRADASAHRNLGTFHPETPVVKRLSDGLRQKFDPKGIFNPGLMA